MRLFLLRHGEAFPGKQDALRELTPKGIASIKKLAEFLNGKDLIPIKEIRHSPLVRARQTAELFKKFAGIEAKLREVPLLQPYDDFRILADLVNKSAEDLFFVGHQPHLGMLASFLLTNDARVDLFNLKKAGLVCLEKIEGTEPKGAWESTWQLRWVVVPRLLKKK